MGSLTDEMRSSHCAIFVDCCFIALSLLFLNPDIITRLPIEALLGAPVPPMLAKNSATISFEKRPPHSTQSRVAARLPANSSTFPALLNKDLRLGDLSIDESLSLDGSTARRRKAAFALLVFATMERSRGAPG